MIQSLIVLSFALGQAKAPPQIPTTYSGSSGVTVSGSAITCDSATASVPGCVSTSAQTFAGAKTWNGVELGPDGAVGAPSWSFANDTDTGIYSIAANTIGFTTGGARAFTMASSADGGVLYGDGANGRLQLSSQSATVASGANYTSMDNSAKVHMYANEMDFNESGNANAYVCFNGTTCSRYLAVTPASSKIDFVNLVDMRSSNYPIVTNAPTLDSANQQMIQHAASAMTAGALAVTFGTAYTSVAPTCTCTHVNTTNSNPCVISVAPSTTAVTFAVASGGTDVVDWICMGRR